MRLMGLSEWDCINFDRREISIRGALVNGEMGPTKTLGSQRDIAMSQLVYDALQEQKARTFGKSEFVFCNSQGNLSYAEETVEINLVN